MGHESRVLDLGSWCVCPDSPQSYCPLRACTPRTWDDQICRCYRASEALISVKYYDVDRALSKSPYHSFARWAVLTVSLRAQCTIEQRIVAQCDKSSAAREVAHIKIREALALRARGAATRLIIMILYSDKKRRALARWKMGTHRIQYELLGEPPVQNGGQQ